MIPPAVDRHGGEPDATYLAEDVARERLFEEAGKLGRIDLDAGRARADPHSNPAEPTRVQHAFGQLDRAKELRRHRFTVRDTGREAGIGRLVPIRESPATGLGPYLVLSPERPEERMPESRLVHRPEPGPVVEEVVPMDAVQILTDGSNGTELAECRGLDRPTVIAAVRPIFSVLRPGERVGREKHMLDANGGRHTLRAGDLLAGYRGTREGDSNRLGAERRVGERRDDGRIDTSREGDHGPSSFPYASFELLHGPRRRSGGRNGRGHPLNLSYATHYPFLLESRGRSVRTVLRTMGATSIAPSPLRKTMQAVREGTRWMLRLDDGQDLFDTLSEFARRENIRAGTVVFGIGMFRRATVGYWDGGQYRPHELSVPHEVVSLHGTIAVAEGVPSLHLHGALAGPDHSVVGGHLLRATVGMLQEVLIETFPGRTFGRPMVESFGLKMLDLEPTREP